MTSRSLSKLLAAGAMSLALTAIGSAHAATYELTFTGTNVSGDVFATTSGNDVTAIWGSLTDADIGPGTFSVTGLSGYASSDNTLAGSAPYLTLGGLSFATVGGGDFNLADLDGYGSYSGYTFLSSTLNPAGGFSDVGQTAVTLDVSVVPEPANLALMAAGLMGLAIVSRRRRDA